LKVRLQAEPQLAATGELQLLRRMVQSEGLADAVTAVAELRRMGGASQPTWRATSKPFQTEMFTYIKQLVSYILHNHCIISILD
jgi:hypothetical protein